MNTETLAATAEEFNPMSLLPDLEKLAGNLETVMRIAVLIGPLCLLGLGLWYLLAPTKEANHSVGFRCWWGMSSVEAWQFTQRLAGLTWTLLGGILSVVMAVICSGFRDMMPDAMAFSAIKCLIWELALVIVSMIAINGILVWQFDPKGYRRPGAKKCLEFSFVDRLLQSITELQKKARK